MQSFSVNYIPNGALIILLTQSSIPISMFVSRILLKAKYEKHNYIGALVVIAGTALVDTEIFTIRSSRCFGSRFSFKGSKQQWYNFFCY